MTRRRARRRVGGEVEHVFAILGYSLLLVLVEVSPGWASLPFLTPAAESAVRWVNLAVILGLVSQVLALTGVDARWRFAVRYLAALVVMVLVGELWSAAAFDFGDAPDAWVGALRMLLILVLAVDVLTAMRAAVGVVRGQRAARLAPGHA